MVPFVGLLAALEQIADRERTGEPSLWHYSPTNMPDTSDRYILDLPRDTLPFRVREYPGRLAIIG
jgi:hypothetical protein